MGSVIVIEQQDDLSAPSLSSRSLVSRRNHRLQAIAHAQFLEKLRQINLGGANGEAELVGDLLVGVALGDVVEELLLSIAQRFLYFRHPFGEQGTADEQTCRQSARDIG